MSQPPNTSQSSDIIKVVLFPEGHGFVFISVLATTGSSKVTIVRSLKDGEFYVRKESNPDFVVRQGTQSNEIQSVKSLGDIDGIPQLIGWTEYHDEQRSNNFVTASYWELYNGGTLQQLMSKLQAGNESLPVVCLFSMYAQMLRVMVQTIGRGVLHMDGHMDNWYVNVSPGTVPKLILGDWGMVESKPTHHTQGCTAYRCIDTCTIRKWWNECSAKLETFVVSHIRDLAGGRKELKEISPYLSLLLETIEKSPPSLFRTGEEWFSMIERLSVLVTGAQGECQANRSRNRSPTVNISTIHDHLQIQRDIRPPLFETAVQQVQTLDGPCFWRVAYIDRTGPTLIGLEGRHARNGYEDHTNHADLPSAWLDDHLRLKQMVESMDGEMEQSEDQGASERYETGFEAFF